MRYRANWSAFAYTPVAILAIILAVTLLPGAKRGDIDPMGVVIGLLGLAATVWSGNLAWRAQRQQETNTTELANRLAAAVFNSESATRRRLLGVHDRSIDVHFTLQPAQHSPTGAALSGQLSTIVDYYRRLTPRRLVITGTPGAGKTVLTLELTLALLQGRRPEDPVPFRLSLSSWNDIRTPSFSARSAEHQVRALREWLCRRLVEDYDMSSPAAQALFDSGKLLPILDGLDEVDSDDNPGWLSMARNAVEVLNTYQIGLRKADLVLTCRRDQYRSLKDASAWVRDSAEIEICPVTATDVRSFIEARADNVSRWLDVLQTIEQETSSSLSEGLSSPWLLTLAVMVYEHRDPKTGRFVRAPEDLLSLDFTRPNSLRDHLLEYFVDSTLAIHHGPRGTRYRGHEVHSWLHTLAKHLYRSHAIGPGSIGNVLLGLPSNNIRMDYLWIIPALQSRASFYFLGFATSIPWLTVLLGMAVFAAAPTKSVIVVAAVALSSAGILLLPLPVNMDPMYIGPGREWTGSILGDGLLGLTGGLVSAVLCGYGFGFGLGSLIWTFFAAAFIAGAGIHIHAAANSDYQRRYWHIITSFCIMGAIGFSFALNLRLDFSSWALCTAGMFAWLRTIGNVLILHGFRYLAMLLCTRTGPNRLPLQPHRFLRWAETAGLVRRAGSAYQFRHIELQHWALTSPVHRP